MAIEILPARLANQIAAGEVVERPASVVKELIENSLDAGATKIAIDIEKGGAKLIRIADNGKGIAKDELTLALSRHATSKIKDLDDLEAIASLGFRGEALASISSVARLTLTSKPAEQENAWQAFATGRDMAVTVQPAAHPNGTTIEVNDLFFNTPARRKFLRTEKTEFTHIDEVLRRIALARFDVSFSLTHNGKMIRQYRAIKNSAQYAKRVGMICGQKFIEQAVTVDCQHDGLHLWGWLAHPEQHRSQNDLCYSYVNGRMMRDKLINHGIRQAFSDWIPNDSYPAFVLFLNLDHKEVDVNVHPAKHEVRFHQGRYVHDFIYTVCQQALQQALSQQVPLAGDETFIQEGTEQGLAALAPEQGANANDDSRDYVAPLRRAEHVGEASPMGYSSARLTGNSSASSSGYHASHSSNSADIRQAAQSYQALMTPKVVESKANENQAVEHKAAENSPGAQPVIEHPQFLHLVDEQVALINRKQSLAVVKLADVAMAVNQVLVEQRWQQGLTSQPLLLPIVLNMSEQSVSWLNSHMALIEQAGIGVQIQAGKKVQIRQFPAMLREHDVASCMQTLIEQMLDYTSSSDPSDAELSNAFRQQFAALMTPKNFDTASAKQLWLQAETVLGDQLNQVCDLKSVAVDLTSAISQLH
ncbi:DNA mismatch repair endonuclease MutL [Thalassotalea euphylliae]|uniref:DNA mismatch repair protein MutL n=1 Tax=Thalassotalea euphylliae TaxID=1655234 RepID=A0A3E0UJE2_9GAMM|nr:DNA mismatch repair endonuclease MutL [Thalassotalea euphylliae]REL37029.1 DNA mismatch repair endonuclease MutL [Thalassotalea euphylliae]